MSSWVDLNKLESNLTCLQPVGRFNGQFNPLMFPPVCTLATQTISLAAVLRRAGVFSLLIVAYWVICFTLLINGIVVALFVTFRHYIHHVSWRLIRVLYRIATREALDFLSEHGTSSTRELLLEHGSAIAGVTVLGFVFFLAVRWAWNRRAERLNRESLLPEPVEADIAGVWPPPPSVHG